MARLTWNDIGKVSLRKLLSTRFCDLDLCMQRAGLEIYVSRLQRELSRVGLNNFRPRVYFGDEWFCPDGSALISVPFYLAHPRLTKITKKLGHTVEGASSRTLMKLLRHEAGHCFNHAFGLNKTIGWRELFGSPNKPYNVEKYSVIDTSTNYVRNLSGYYAQSHPDEDFAETFAAYLAGDWRQKYQDWPGALRKLKYVDARVREIAERGYSASYGRPLSDVRQMRSTLERFFSKSKVRRV